MMKENLSMHNTGKIRRPKTSEILLREYVRDVLLTQPSRGELMSEWDLVRAWARGNTLLSEAAHARGKKIAEGLLDGLQNAVSFVGGKVGSAWNKVKKQGDDIQKAFILIIEKIPGGKAAFEMLKEFSSDIAEKAKDAVRDAIKEFANFLKEQKNSMIEFVLGKANDPGAKEKIKELLDKAKGDAKNWLDTLLKNPKEAIKQLYGGAREAIGGIAKIVVSGIMKGFPEIPKELSKRILATDFFKNKAASAGLVIRLMSLLGGEMKGEEVVKAGLGLYKSIKSLASGGSITPDNPADIISDELPRIIGGLVAGDNPVEQSIRAAMGDPTAATKLIKSAISTIISSIKTATQKLAPDAVKQLGLDPNSTKGKALIAGINALVGAGAGKLAGG